MPREMVMYLLNTRGFIINPKGVSKDYDVLLCVLEWIKLFGEGKPINQAEIAKKLSMKNENVSRSLKKLVKKGILIKGDKVGIFNTYKAAELEINDYER